MAILRSIKHIARISLILAFSGMPVFAQQPSGCTATNLSGSYAFNVSGINVGPNYYSFVGRFVADGRGNVVGKGIESLNGEISRPTFTATYTVAADCTGETTLAFDDGGSAVLQFVIADDGNDVEIIVAAGNGPGQNETGRAIKQFPRRP